jgi:hypothetical protein
MTTTTKIASPLSRKATLVAVKIGGWSARKLDREITAETNARHNASADAGRYNKLLINTERLAKLTSLASQARTLHYSLTSPWADEGARVLPNAFYSKFTDEFRILKREFSAAADEFARDYPAFVQERKAQLNGAFKESDYPSASEIRGKFRLEIAVLPFPDAADFRSDLDDDTVADIRAEIEATSGAVLQDSLKDAAERIIKKVGHMAAKLKEYKTGKPGERKFFADSLVENVRELAAMLPAFNLADDAALTAITERIEKELCAEDAQALRDNDSARESVAKSADDIVAEVSKFLA